MERKGRFGKYGGQYVSETLMSALIELESGYDAIQKDPHLCRHFTRTRQTLPDAPHRSRSVRICPGNSGAGYT